MLAIMNGLDEFKTVDIVNLGSNSTSCLPLRDYPLTVRGTVAGRWTSCQIAV